MVRDSQRSSTLCRGEDLQAPVPSSTSAACRKDGIRRRDPRKAYVLLVILVLTSCSARYSPFFGGWGEWVEGNVAGLKNSSTAGFDYVTLPGVITSIDGIVVGEGYVKARLSPGKHQLEYADQPAKFGSQPTGLIEVQLVAGHEYEFQIEYCYWCHPRKFAAWVEDKATGELVWGKKPDWPSWWL